MTTSSIKEPLVSIIVITYNSANYVLETLNSAYNQTYKNIELIVSDDGSTDNTIEICKKWLEQNRDKFDRTELLTSKENTGIPRNCNRGLIIANGEWIKLIAGDDILINTCIADNIEYILSNTDAKFLASSMQYIDKNGNICKSSSNRNDDFRKYYFSVDARKQLKTYARFPVFLNSPSFFINRKAIIDVGYFDEEFIVYEDICIIYKFNKSDLKIYYLNKDTVKYRITDTAISQQTNQFIDNIRKKEQISIFRKYRIKHLSYANIIDLSVYYEFWLKHKYTGFFRYKALRILKYTCFIYWYVRYINLFK